MSVVARGTKNAFRNVIRSFSITLILAISIGLSLVMLLSMRAVNARIASVKGTIGNVITVAPAGARGFAGGGNPLTNDNVAQIKSTDHVVSVTASINDRLDNGTGAAVNTADNATSTDAVNTTTLVSPIAPGSLGRRFRGGGSTQATVPVTVTGTSDPTSTQVAGANQFKLTSGKTIDGSSSINTALVGKDLAAKNNLSVGSTFLAYGQTITVAGIFDAGNTFANAGVIMPLPTIQNLSGQPGDVTNVIVQVDSISNLAATTTALQAKLGSAADVVSAQDSSNQALAPLENIKTISLYSLIGALAAGSIIIFLTMLMIVRERRREIGVLKAIGASNIKIMAQFVIEALTLTLLGAIVGVATGVALSNPILRILVSSSSSTGGGRPVMIVGGFGGGLGRTFDRVGGAITSLHAVIGYDIFLYGLLAAVGITILGSAIPAWLIAKVRPAEVMRSE